MSEYAQDFKLGGCENNLIVEIYKCALEPSNWRKVLSGIQAHLGALEVTLLFYDARMRSRNFAAAAMADDEMTRRFVSEFIDIEADIARQSIAKFSEGTVVDAIALRDDTGEIYEQSLGEASQFDSRPNWEVQIAVPLLIGTSVFSSIGIYQAPGGKNPTPAAIDFINHLTSHLVQAIRIHNHISYLHQENSSLYASIERSPLGVFLLNHQGAVIFSNSEAMRIIKADQSLKISRFGKLQAPLRQDQEKIDSVLTTLLYKQGINAALGDGVTLPVYKADAIHPLKITLLPFSNHNISEQEICVAVFVNDPERPLSIPFEYVQHVYKLTPAECEIAQALLDASSIEEIAGKRGTTLGTARWQVKKVMEKTQCHSQSELCKLMMSLCDNFSIHSAINS